MLILCLSYFINIVIQSLAKYEQIRGSCFWEQVQTGHNPSDPFPAHFGAPHYRAGRIVPYLYLLSQTTPTILLILSVWLYYKWCVKKDFSFAHQFFLLISDSLGSVSTFTFILQIVTFTFILQIHRRRRKTKVSLIGVVALWGDCTFIPAYSES